MRRFIRLILVCGTIGLAVNVGVAWLLAISMEFPGPSRARRETLLKLRPWPVRVPGHWPPPREHIYWRMPGLHYDVWAGGPRRPGDPSYNADEATFGWPWPSLTAATVRETDFSGPSSKYVMTERDYPVWIIGLPAPGPPPSPPPYRASYRLPIRPRWMPFVGSSLVFAFPPALAGFVWARLRAARRARRGHCAACGYNLSGLTPGTLCPECGAAVASRNPPAA